MPGLCLLPAGASVIQAGVSLLGLYAAVYAAVQCVSAMPPSLCLPIQMIIKMAAM